MCPSTRIQLFLKTEIFSVLAFCPHENGAVGTILTQFLKNNPRMEFCEHHPWFIVYLWTDEKRRFSNSMISYIIFYSLSELLSYFHRFSVFICFLFCFVSSIFNQHNSIHRFFYLAILYGETTGHNVMFSAVIADAFVFRKWWNQ